MRIFARPVEGSKSMGDWLIFYWKMEYEFQKVEDEKDISTGGPLKRSVDRRDR